MKKLCVVCNCSRDVNCFSADPMAKDGLSHACIKCADGMARFQKAVKLDARREHNRKYYTKRKAIGEMLK